MNTSRQRLDEFRHQRRSVADHDGNRFLKKTVSQLIACLVIFAVVFIITKIDTPECKKAAESIKNALSYHVDYIAATKSMMTKIKEIPNKFSEDKKEDAVEESTPAPLEDEAQNDEQNTQDETEKEDEDENENEDVNAD